MNFALLGNIAFDLLNAPSAFDERRAATYAEHAVLSGKPRLQAMGLELTEITLQLKLHHQLAPVDERYQALITAKETQEALALVLGWSQFKGHFVIAALESQTLFCDEQGNALAREVSITLREFVGNTGKGLLGAALSIGGNSPLASLLPKGLTNFVSQAAKLVQKGIKIYRQARQVISAVREIITTIKAIANDPLQALTYLPAVVNQLGGSIGGLGEMVGLGSSFATLTQGLKGAEPFLMGVADLSRHLNTAQREFKLGLNERNLGQWFDLGVKAIDAADEVAQSMSKPAAQLTAWIATRGDTPEPTTQGGTQWTV
ncbi:phage tail protein [Pasteurella multocida]|uniref:phage tail protein n=1 Tax=Pasteurella multocida TaxID=747 RepID=UPI0020257AB8|nr:phage tail protein [Pasteurella multocida]URJ96620.1 phage tail protein [Pasteurella multocida]HDR1428750.1 phage tail protein [Pasteurella multocida]HDV7289192.1 phage tail protein [Pasteurella multocida]